MSLEEIRQNKIKVVINTLQLARKAGTSIDFEKLIQEVSLLYGTARRTSMDYIELAMRQLGASLVRIGGIQEIFFKSENYDAIIDESTNELRDMLLKEKNALKRA